MNERMNGCECFASIKFDVWYVMYVYTNISWSFFFLVLYCLFVVKSAVGIDMWIKHRLLHFIRMMSICWCPYQFALQKKNTNQDFASIRYEISDWSSSVSTTHVFLMYVWWWLNQMSLLWVGMFNGALHYQGSIRYCFIVDRWNFWLTL